MDNLERAQRDWENPPDEPDAVFCEECGEELEYKDYFSQTRFMKCVNPLCPSKYDGIEKEMAETIVGLTDQLNTAHRLIEILEHKLERYSEDE